MSRVLSPQDEEYLRKRGYTTPLLLQEAPFSILKGNVLLNEGITFFARNEYICWEVRAMSGSLAGVHTTCRLERNYNWYQTPGKPYLPILFGSPEDYQKLYESGEMVLSEGIFDRVAMKLMVPEKAHFARLSKGISGQLAHFMNRYVKRLWVAFDNDEAGELGMEKAEKRLGHIEMIRITYPAKDPSQLLEKKGFQQAQQIIKRRMELSF